MNSRQRVSAVLNRENPDRIPRFEVWVDALYEELGVADPLSAHPELGQDNLLIPSQPPDGSNAWKDGLDEFGRVWKKGMYFSGMVRSYSDLKRFSPPPGYALRFFNEGKSASLLSKFPDHFPFFGTHIGPFMNTYMAMGMSTMFRFLGKNKALVKAVMEKRTEWCLAVFKRAVELGAELIVLGDDAAHSGGPMISPALWEELVLPFHQAIVEGLSVPVIWHSDGQMEKLLPYAVKAGFIGVHGLEPPAGNRLDIINAEYGDRLILVGNLDVNILCENDLEAVGAEVRRCIEQGGRSGYMLSTSNSIFPGMNPAAVRCYLEYELTKWKNNRSQ